MAFMEERKCRLCDTTKPISEFSRNKSKPGGYRYECKPCDAVRVKKDRPRYRYKKFGLTVEEYNSMSQKQCHVCAICGNAYAVKLAVDHCHKTGKIRGLLCRSCNVGLGYFKDNVSLLDKAKIYLTK